MVDLGPYLALAELKDGARIIAFDKDVHQPNAFYIARSDFLGKYPAQVARLNTVFASEGEWADAHHEEVARRRRKRPAWISKPSGALSTARTIASCPLTTRWSGASRRWPIALHGLA